MFDSHRCGDWQLHISLKTLDSAALKPCQSTAHVIKIIPHLAAIPGFQQRWRQRGKTYGLQLYLKKTKQHTFDPLSIAYLFSKGHCTPSPKFSSEIFARWKINTTSRYVNHVYTLPPKFSSVIKNSDRVRFFAFFASVASILRGVLIVQSHRRSERQNPEWQLSSSSTSSRSTKHCI